MAEKKVVDDGESADDFITTKKSIGFNLGANFVRSNPEFISSPDLSARKSDGKGKKEEKEVVDEDEPKKPIGLNLAANFVRSNPEFITSVSTSTTAVDDNATGDFSFPK